MLLGKTLLGKMSLGKMSLGETTSTQKIWSCIMRVDNSYNRL
jgi:hypothetical protein